MLQRGRNKRPTGPLNESEEPSMNQLRSFKSNLAVGWAVALGAVVGTGTGCEPSNTVTPGAAVMLSFGAVDLAAPLDTYGGPMYTTTPLIGPRSEFIAIFDRL